jgi:hypothetical protein
MIKPLPDDQYTEIFQNLANSVGRRTGVQLPKHIEIYCVLLLADHMRKGDWEPRPSFAECYMTINSALAAREFGDECLFLCGVFPEYAERRGMKITYYQSLGQSAYLKASKELNPSIFEPMAQHFDLISKWILSVTRQQNSFNF